MRMLLHTCSRSGTDKILESSSYILDLVRAGLDLTKVNILYPEDNKAR